MFGKLVEKFEGKNSTDVLNVKIFPLGHMNRFFTGERRKPNIHDSVYPARQRNIVEMKTHG